MGLPVISLGTRRLIACAAILVFLVFWIWAAASIGGLLPRQPWIQLVYYAVAGMGWGLPILPVISWSENYKGRKGK